MSHLYREKEQEALLAERAANSDEAVDDLEEAQDIIESSYNEYSPKKFKLGKSHPDVLVESSSLSACDPPDITYSLHLPTELISSGELSSPQLETICYASQVHEQLIPGEINTRKGFFLGDGAGVGKGRQLAGILYENWICGRHKHLWFSASADLHLDAQRDLKDIGAGDVVACYKQLPLKNYRIALPSGVIFSTYNALISSTRHRNSYGNVSKKQHRRIDQLVEWCGGENFEGCITFDECHKAKNLVASNSNGKPTQMGLAVLEIQRRLPNARVVYCSATGCSEPADMAYMVRLGLWGPKTSFPSGFSEFRKSFEQGGVGMMELVSMHLKRQGQYICRTLSYHGCEFKVDEHALDQAAIELYDASVRLWIQLYEQILDRFVNNENFLEYFPSRRNGRVLAKQSSSAGSSEYESNNRSDSDDGDDDEDEDFSDDDDDSEYMDIKEDEEDTKPLTLPQTLNSAKVTIMRYYWNAHQRFFRSLCISLKVPRAIQICKEALSQGKAVVIGLQTTGDAAAIAAGQSDASTQLSRKTVGAVDVDDDGSNPTTVEQEFASTPAATLRKVVYKLFPLPPKPKSIKAAERAKWIAGVNAKEAEMIAAANAEAALAPWNNFNNDSTQCGGATKNNKLIRKSDELENQQLPLLLKSSSFGRTSKKQKVNYKEPSDDEGLFDSSDADDDLNTISSVNSASSSEAKVALNGRKRLRNNNSSSVPSSRNSAQIPAQSTTISSGAPMGKGKGINGWSIFEHEGWLIGSTAAAAAAATTPSLPLPHYLHSKVRKTFKRTTLNGTIVAYLAAAVNDGMDLWHVVYCDGDEEDWELHEVLKGIKEYNRLFMTRNNSNATNLTAERKDGSSSGKKGKVPVVKKFISEKKVAVKRKAIVIDDTDDDGDEVDDDDSASDFSSENNSSSDEDEYASINNNTDANADNLVNDEDTEIVAAAEKKKEAKYVDALEHRTRTLASIAALSLPGNPLDVIIDSVGGAHMVAEMTGRQTRLVRDENTGRLETRRRNEDLYNINSNHNHNSSNNNNSSTVRENGSDNNSSSSSEDDSNSNKKNSKLTGCAMQQRNIFERDLFQQDVKQVAIISEAASAGISLHADRRVRNQRRRVHITLELPWSADRAVQQLGRSHRSNQSSGPEYYLLISPQGGERRFAAAVAKRLESLGALTQGDRSATVGAKNMSITSFNFDTKYGKKAIVEMFAALHVNQFRGKNNNMTTNSAPTFPDLPEELALEIEAMRQQAPNHSLSSLPPTANGIMQQQQQKQHQQKLPTTGVVPSSSSTASLQQRQSQQPASGTDLISRKLRTIAAEQTFLNLQKQQYTKAAINEFETKKKNLEDLHQKVLNLLQREHQTLEQQTLIHQQRQLSQLEQMNTMLSQHEQKQKQEDQSTIILRNQLEQGHKVETTIQKQLHQMKIQQKTESQTKQMEQLLVEHNNKIDNIAKPIEQQMKYLLKQQQSLLEQQRLNCTPVTIDESDRVTPIVSTNTVPIIVAHSNLTTSNTTDDDCVGIVTQKPLMQEQPSKRKLNFAEAALFWLRKVDLAASNRDQLTVPRFLNRILGLPSRWQRSLFDLFCNILEGLIRQAKKEMSYDQGIMEIRGSSIQITTGYPRTVWKTYDNHDNDGVDGDLDTIAANTTPLTAAEAAATAADCVHHYVLKVDRGCCWEDAVNLLDAASSEANNSNTSIKNNNKKKNSIVNGFYCTRNAYQGRHFIALAIEKAVIIHSHAAALAINVTIIRPTTGRNEMNRMTLKEKYRLLDSREEAQEMWEKQFTESSQSSSDDTTTNPSSSSSSFSRGRYLMHNILCGSVLNIWKTVEAVYDLYNESSNSHIVSAGGVDAKRFVMRVARVAVPSSTIETSKTQLVSTNTAVTCDKSIQIKQENNDNNIDSISGSVKKKTRTDAATVSFVKKERDCSSFSSIGAAAIVHPPLSLIGVWIPPTRIAQVLKALHKQQYNRRIAAEQATLLNNQQTTEMKRGDIFTSTTQQQLHK